MSPGAAGHWDDCVWVAGMLAKRAGLGFEHGERAVRALYADPSLAEDGEPDQWYTGPERVALSAKRATSGEPLDLGSWLPSGAATECLAALWFDWAPRDGCWVVGFTDHGQEFLAVARAHYRYPDRIALAPGPYRYSLNELDQVRARISDGDLALESEGIDVCALFLDQRLNRVKVVVEGDPSGVGSRLRSRFGEAIVVEGDDVVTLGGESK